MPLLVRMLRMTERWAIRNQYWIRGAILVLTVAGVSISLTYLLRGMVQDCQGGLRDCQELPDWFGRQYAVILLLPVVWQAALAAACSQLPTRQRGRWRIGALVGVLASGGLFVFVNPDFTEAYSVFVAGSLAVAILDATVPDALPKSGPRSLLRADTEFGSAPTFRRLRTSRKYFFSAARANVPNLVRSLNQSLAGGRRLGGRQELGGNDTRIEFRSGDVLILVAGAGGDCYCTLELKPGSRPYELVEAILGQLAGPRRSK